VKKLKAFDLKLIPRFLALASVVVLVFIIWLSQTPPSDTANHCVRYEQIPESNYVNPVTRNKCSLSLEKVDTDATREKGLSGRSSMPRGSGMLFVFDNIGRQCIWMKDMKFPLDIIWLNSQGNIIKIAENVAPSTYPDEFCAKNALLVIEVNAGVAKSHGLTVGTHISL